MRGGEIGFGGVWVWPCGCGGDFLISRWWQDYNEDPKESKNYNMAR